MYIDVVLAFLLACSLHASSAVIYRCNQTAACGCSAFNANMLRVVGGEDAFPASWGWAVSLQSLNGEHFCTGSVVSPLHVITAAHCVTIPNFLQETRVVIGIDRLSDNTSRTIQIRRISHVFHHPSYDDVIGINDIAVLRLNASFMLSADSRTTRVCLPRIEPSSATSDYPGDYGPLVAIGWGALKFGDENLPDTLQQVTVQAIPAADDRCGIFIHNASTQLCAGVDGGGKDTCQGDSGGPLMRFEPKLKQWVLAGLTSYGEGCADARYAGVYTRVSMFREWLRSVISDEFIEVEGESYSSATENRLSICLMLFAIVMRAFVA